MHVLFASAEFAPIAQVGGLGIATGGLVQALRDLGLEVTVAIPDYSDIELVGEEVADLEVPAWAAPARVRLGEAPGAGRVAAIGVPGIRRPNPYVQADGQGWPDNDRRFFAYSAAVAALAIEMPFDVLHLNDWHLVQCRTQLLLPPCFLQQVGNGPLVLPRNAILRRPRIRQCKLQCRLPIAVLGMHVCFCFK